ncbi:T9SS type A sorting domain-containing protein [uncultured Draconibacterium sp.]|uniref:T9SS type A sorting domain-containing protein n=1 Tax=uncultured Draconibacterium sp. TaxID=1573823 RepID=UPI003261043F
MRKCKYIAGLLLFILPLFLQAQIGGAEYFVDSDPGFGAATAIPGATGTEVDVNFSVDLGSLDLGIHAIGIRVQSNGAWGMTRLQNFLVTYNRNGLLSDMEYFLDSDPGIGQATPVTVTGGASLNENFNADLSGLTQGLHCIGLRVKAGERGWSSTRTQNVLVIASSPNEEIVAAEYFIDSDPGIGSAIAVAVTPSQEMSTVFLPDLDSFANGLHTIGVRVQSASGVWSMVRSQSFLLNKLNTNEDIVAAEYFVNTDPGVGQANEIPVEAGREVTLAFSPGLDSLENGLHTIGVRTQSESGNWSMVRTSSFMLLRQSTSATAMEYFFDTDPGIGQAIQIANTGGEKHQAEAFAVDVSGLTPGLHTIFVRAQGNLGEWGMVAMEEFCHGAVPDFSLPEEAYRDSVIFIENRTANSSDSTQYFWDFDDDGIYESSLSGDTALVFQDTGSYTISLMTGDSSTCFNTIQKTVHVAETPLYNIEFFVTDNSGNLISNAEIEFEYPDAIIVSDSIIHVYDVPAGTYGYIITSDGYQPYSFDLTVSDHDLMVSVSLQPEACQLIVYDSLTIAEVLCYNSNEGEYRVVSIVGDSTLYTLEIRDMDADTILYEIHDVDSFGYTVSGLLPGNYSSQIYSGNCEYNRNFTITEPEPLLVESTIRGIARWYADSLEIIDAVAFGGTAPFRYQVLRDGVIVYPFTEVDSFIVSTGAEYEIYVQDANGCLVSTIIYIESPSICSQHFHPVWEGSNAYEPMNIFVIDAKIDGIDLESGDQIGVFDGDVCVGYGKVEETISESTTLSIIVGADDYESDTVGFFEGNEITYKLWRCNDQMEFSTVAKKCYNNQAAQVVCPTFQIGGSSYVALSVIGDVNLATDFSVGWNIFSSPVVPDSSDLEFVFSDLINTGMLIKIQDEAGASLEDHGTFGGWINAIGNLHPAEGYKVKVAEYDSLYLSGQLVNYPYGIVLSSGWNIIGFPSMNIVDGMDIVQQLIDNGSLLKVQDQQGNSIEDLGMFGGWQNFIGNFWAGRGFKVKVSAPDTLWIYENYPKSSTTSKAPVKPQHFSVVYNGNGVDHMNFNFVNLGTEIMAAGDELAVFDGEDCVGAVTLLPEHLEKQMVALSASSADGSGMTGFNEGNTYNFRLWQAGVQHEINIEPELVAGEPVFIKHESALLSMNLLEMGANELAEMVAVNCYPNPFNDAVTLRIDLASDSKVEVLVMNQMGQCIHRLCEEQQMSRGNHKLQWTGTADGGGSVSSGIYYLRIHINDKMYNKKIVYNK